MTVLKIAARRSDLARIQVYEVAQALRAVFPQLEIEFQFSQSLGDKNLSDPLWQMPEKGVFTRDLQDVLIRGQADMVVHSWKDLPIDGFDQTEVVATLPRQDARDLLLFKRSRLDEYFQSASAASLRILSSSPRRAHNLQFVLPDLLPFPVQSLQFEPVRGNVGTRIDKLLNGDCDGLIVAAAALNRLLYPPKGFEAQLEESAGLLSQKLKSCNWMLLPLKENPTAAAQGALAIEIKRDREDLRKILSQINHKSTFDSVVEERRLLSSYGGGCHQKIGISLQNFPFGDVLSVRGIDEKSSQGTASDLRRWELAKNAPITPKANPEEIWPMNAEDSAFFRRKPLVVTQPTKESGLFITRVDALPEDWPAASLREHFVWASGSKTWRKLAKRGIWVHGTTEGLGEQKPCFGMVPAHLTWVKLSHQLAEGLLESPMQTLATYELLPKLASEAPKFHKKKFYYWMSATAFQRALELDPNMRFAHHSCGPGNTYAILKLLAEKKGFSISLYLDFDHWKESILTPG